MTNQHFEKLLSTNSAAHNAFQTSGSPEHVAVVLGVQNEKLFQRIAELELIAPKKVRKPNGEIMIWRCPDHLVPEP